VLGALIYTYYLDRAHPDNLVHISPPAVALLFVWLGIMRLTFDSRTAVAVATGTVIFLGAMIVASEGEDIRLKYPGTALAAVLGSTPSLGSQLRALWHNPVADPIAAHVVAFVSSLGSTRGGLTILLTPSTTTEALLRLDAANAVGSSQPCEESLSAQGPARVATAVRLLRPGGIVVISEAPQDAGQLLPIQRYAFALLAHRFKLQQIGGNEQGLRAFRMTKLITGPVGSNTNPVIAPQPVLSVEPGCG
jgi:hypothetical protein